MRIVTDSPSAKEECSQVTSRLVVAVLAILLTYCAGAGSGNEYESDRAKLEDCLLSVLSQCSAEDREYLRSNPPELAMFHLKFKPMFRTVCDVNSPLGHVLSKRGLVDVSDQEELIARAVQHRLRGQPFDFDATAKEIKEHAARFEEQQRRRSGGGEHWK